jgi:hypothetical protein
MRSAFPMRRLSWSRRAPRTAIWQRYCTDAALGGWSSTARNAEASVYRRLQPGAVRAAFGVDLGTKLKEKAIRPQLPIESEAAVDEPPFNPEYFELSYGLITWYPHGGIDAEGAVISFGDLNLPVMLRNGRWCAELHTPMTRAAVVHVTLRSGQVSSPTILHDEGALRRAAPGQIDARLRDAFERVRRGEEDLLDLAQYARVIFALEPVQAKATQFRGSDSRIQTVVNRGIDYPTAQEFRRAVALEPAMGASGRFSVDETEPVGKGDRWVSRDACPII